MAGRSKAKTSRYRWESVWKAHAWFGFTAAEIADSLKIHHSTVGYYLQKGPPPGFDLTNSGRIADKKPPVVRRSSANSQRKKPTGTVVPFGRKTQR